MRRFRSSVLGATLLTLAVIAGACGESGGGDGNNVGNGEGKPELTVGSDSFAEAQIVGEMYAQVLENAGYTISRQLEIESREIRLPAMESGDIDIAPEYLATLLSVIDPSQAPSTDTEEVKQQLEVPLETKGLVLLEPSTVIDTNAFVVTQETAADLGLRTVSDLEGKAHDLTLGGPAECPERAYCIPGLKKVYNVEFADFKPLEYGASMVALSGEEIDVALLFSTDGSIAENDFVVLEDDKQLQAADTITPLVRREVLTDEIERLLNEVSAALETDRITELNKRVNVDEEDPGDLAREFLTDKGLI